MSNSTIAIIGASFAGLRAYISLKKIFPKATFYLFDKEEYFTFIPSFHLTLCKPSHLKKSQLSLKKYFGEAFINEEVKKLNKHSLTTNKKTYTFDYAIVATGAQVNYFGNKNLEKHALGAKSLSHLKEIWKRLPDAKNVVVIGAGLSGVEYAGMLGMTTKKNVTLINATDRVVPNLSVSASHYTHNYLDKHGVKVYHNVRAESATKHSVTLSSGEIIPADLILMCTGLKQVPPFPFPSKITKHLNLEECDNIYFCGDVARSDKVPTAHSAMIEGDIVASHVAAKIQGKESSPRVMKKQTSLAVGLGPRDGFIAFKTWHLPLPFITGFIKLHIEQSVLLSFKWRIKLYI